MGIMDYEPTYTDSHSIVYRLRETPVSIVRTVDTSMGAGIRISGYLYDTSGFGYNNTPCVQVPSWQEMRKAYWDYLKVHADRPKEGHTLPVRRVQTVKAFHRRCPTQIEPRKAPLPSTRAHRRALRDFLRG